LRLNKKVLVVASSLALATSVTVGSATSAWAAAPKIDVSTRSVTCNDILGKIKFAVPLTLGGTTANQITLSIKSGDCVDNDQGAFDCEDLTYVESGTCLNPDGVTLKNYAAKGILNSTTNDCLGLQGLSTGTTGSVTGKFATMPGTSKLLNATNTLSVSQTYGGTINDGGLTTPASDDLSWGAQYGFFHIGPADAPMPATTAPTVTGAYANDGGTSFDFSGTTAQSSGDLATACFTTGIKGIQFGIGGFTS
jgi:hypothetical protein